MQVVYVLKIKSPGSGGCYIASLHKTEKGAIKERQRNIDMGTYKPDKLEVVTRFLFE